MLPDQIDLKAVRQLERLGDLLDSGCRGHELDYIMRNSKFQTEQFKSAVLDSMNELEKADEKSQ